MKFIKTLLLGLLLLAGTKASAQALRPTSLTYGTQAVGTTSGHQTVHVSGGSTGLTIASITVSGDFILKNYCGGSLAPGFGCDTWVYFKPTASGTRTGTFTLTGSTTLSIPLSGTGSSGAPPPPPPGVSVSISPTTILLQTGATLQFTATVSNAADPSVTWTAAGDGGVTTTGLFTAGTMAGTATVTATSVLDSTKSATAQVTVTAVHSLVQARPLGPNGFGTVSLSFNSPNTAGHTIVVGTDYGDAAGFIRSVTDSAGNTYVAANSQLVDPNQGLVLQVWVAKNIASGSNTVTITPSGGAPVNFIIAEFNPGTLSGEPVSSGTYNFGGGTDAMDSGFIRADGTEILIGWGRAANSQPSAGTGWTQAALSNDHQILEYRVGVPAGTAVRATASLGSDNNWCMQVISLN